MGRIFIVIFCLMIASFYILADGLKFDESRSHLKENALVLKIYPGQQMDISRRRTLTLTDSQYETLSARVKNPQRQFRVLTNRFDDCVCGMGAVAVWFRNGEVEIPLALASEEPASPDSEAFPYTPPLLILDEYAVSWSQGRRVRQSEWKKRFVEWEKERLAKDKADNESEETDVLVYKEVKDEWLTASVKLPPRLSDTMEKRIKTILDELSSIGRQYKIRLIWDGVILRD